MTRCFAAVKTLPGCKGESPSTLIRPGALQKYFLTLPHMQDSAPYALNQLRPGGCNQLLQPSAPR